jgi:hypothetical protein
MIRLRPWQWAVLALPLAAIVGFMVTAAGLQIHAWGLNWIWAVMVIVLVGWRWLLARWTRPTLAQMESALTQARDELAVEVETDTATGSPAAQAAEAALERILAQAQADPPLWEDWNPLLGPLSRGDRCRYPGLPPRRQVSPAEHLPVPDAYGLMRGTVDDVDRWIENLTPVLGQVTLGQAVQGYELYRRWSPRPASSGRPGPGPGG